MTGLTAAGEGWPDGKPAWADSYVAGRRLDTERWIVVMRLTFGRARLSVCTADVASLEAY